MSTTTAEIRDRLRGDPVAARHARRAGDHRRGWRLLEDAHVMSQPWAWWHIRVHGAMFAAGVRERDDREVWGQLVRLMVAGPGSITRRYPLGNTGRARVPATQPEPVPPDLAELLGRAGR
jgi:hypothetical protein